MKMNFVKLNPGEAFRLVYLQSKQSPISGHWFPSSYSSPSQRCGHPPSSTDHKIISNEEVLKERDEPVALFPCLTTSSPLILIVQPPGAGCWWMRHAWCPHVSDTRAWGSRSPGALWLAWERPRGIDVELGEGRGGLGRGWTHHIIHPACVSWGHDQALLRAALGGSRELRPCGDCCPHKWARNGQFSWPAYVSDLRKFPKAFLSPFPSA